MSHKKKKRCIQHGEIMLKQVAGHKRKAQMFWLRSNILIALFVFVLYSTFGIFVMVKELYYK